MKIAFLLPNYSGCVVGSLLVYYRFARHLASLGHTVDLYHPLLTSNDATFLERFRIRCTTLVKNLSRRPVRWMDFPNRVTPRFRTLLSGLDLKHDKVIAFSWRAVEALSDVRTTGEIFGYIVEYESWVEASPSLRSRMEEAYRKSIPLLASSTAVFDMLGTVGALDRRMCVHGVDMNPPDQAPLEPSRRDSRRVGFPVRVEPVKSPEVLRETCRLLKERHGSEIVLWGFGSSEIPRSLREFLDEYHPEPSDEELYGLYEGSAIFAVPSRKEGFGMPAAEAMAHGCAVVSVDNGGVRTYAREGENCLLVPPDSPIALADAISSLLVDSERRLALAVGAPASVRFLEWSQAGSRFERALGL